MKIFMGNAINFAIAEEEKGPAAIAELVLIYTETDWSLDRAGDLIRSSDTGSFRLSFSAKSLRSFSKWLGTYADDMQDLERRTKIEEKPPTV